MEIKCFSLSQGSTPTQALDTLDDWEDKIISAFRIDICKFFGSQLLSNDNDIFMFSQTLVSTFAISGEPSSLA